MGTEERAEGFSGEAGRSRKIIHIDMDAKRLAAGYSADEKTALFSGAAKKAYRLEV
jgi:hypothetical protein